MIADLFAHEGFAGCRSEAANALTVKGTKRLNKLKYKLEHVAGAGAVKTMGLSRVGHGQAGQRPDEPFVNYKFTRSTDGRLFEKNNYEIFGEALMTVTEVLKGNMLVPFKDWKEKEKEQDYT